MEAITIRRAAEADWPRIWPVWREVVTAGDTYEYRPDTPEAEAHELWLSPEPVETWLADADGAVLGTYQLKANRRGLGDHVANAGYMVAAPARGQGIGRALAVHSLDRARDLGYSAMQFNAVVATNHRAIALWRALGFIIVGTVPDAFRRGDNEFVDVHVMHRYL
jgi:GNAT superfamily N-acetyltransferase